MSKVQEVARAKKNAAVEEVLESKLHKLASIYDDKQLVWLDDWWELAEARGGSQATRASKA